MTSRYAYLISANSKLAKTTEPKRPWRTVTAQRYSAGIPEGGRLSLEKDNLSSERRPST
jgi:hypothetical protein